MQYPRISKPRSKRSNQNGQGLTEYIILVMMIAIGCLAAVKGFSTAVKSRIYDAQKTLNAKLPLMSSGSNATASDDDK